MSDATPFATHRLGEIADVRFSSVDKKSRADEHSVRLCNYVDVLRNTAIVPGLELMMATASESERMRFGLQKGDVVFTKDSETAEEIGLASIVADDLPDLVLGYHLGFARVSRPDLVDSAYLFRAFQAPSTLRYFSRKATGAVRAALSLGSVKNTPIPLLPIRAQRKIAALLSAADRAIQAADKLVAAKREFKRGLMQDLLTGRRRFPGFEGAWEERRLAEICSVNPPTKLAPDKSASVTFVPMRDVLEGGGYNGVEHVAGTRASSGYTPFQESDILVAKITPCFENGKCWLAQGLLGGFGLGSTEFHVIRPSSEVDPHWVYAHVRSERFRGKGATNMVGSAGQKRVPATFVRNYSVDVPSLKEQRAISGVLSTLDAEITHLETLAAQLREQKRGLMQRLFSGELDLSTLDTDAAADAAPREVSA